MDQPLVPKWTDQLRQALNDQCCYPVFPVFGWVATLVHVVILAISCIFYAVLISIYALDCSKRYLGEGQTKIAADIMNILPTFVLLLINFSALVAVVLATKLVNDCMFCSYICGNSARSRDSSTTSGIQLPSNIKCLDLTDDMKETYFYKLFAWWFIFCWGVVVVWFSHLPCNFSNNLLLFLFRTLWSYGLFLTVPVVAGILSFVVKVCEKRVHNVCQEVNLFSTETNAPKPAAFWSRMAVEFRVMSEELDNTWKDGLMCPLLYWASAPCMIVFFAAAALGVCTQDDRQMFVYGIISVMAMYRMYLIDYPLAHVTSLCGSVGQYAIQHYQLYESMDPQDQEAHSRFVQQITVQPSGIHLMFVGTLDVKSLVLILRFSGTAFIAAFPFLRKLVHPD